MGGLSAKELLHSEKGLVKVPKQAKQTRQGYTTKQGPETREEKKAESVNKDGTVMAEKRYGID